MHPGAGPGPQTLIPLHTTQTTTPHWARTHTRTHTDTCAQRSRRLLYCIQVLRQAHAACSPHTPLLTATRFSMHARTHTHTDPGARSIASRCRARPTQPTMSVHPGRAPRTAERRGCSRHSLRGRDEYRQLASPARSTLTRQGTVIRTASRTVAGSATRARMTVASGRTGAHRHRTCCQLANRLRQALGSIRYLMSVCALEDAASEPGRPACVCLHAHAGTSKKLSRIGSRPLCLSSSHFHTCTHKCTYAHIRTPLKHADADAYVCARTHAQLNTCSHGHAQAHSRTASGPDLARADEPLGSSCVTKSWGERNTSSSWNASSASFGCSGFTGSCSCRGRFVGVGCVRSSGMERIEEHQQQLDGRNGPIVFSYSSLVGSSSSLWG